MYIHHATLETCSAATDTVVVIDVIRAFTTAAFAFAAGARDIVPVGTVEEALALCERFPGALVMGGVDRLPPESFDFGNSPAALIGRDLRGRRIIQRTPKGTQGIVRSVRAETLLASSFVCAGATADYIKIHSLIALLFILVVATIGCTSAHESVEGICGDAKETIRSRVDQGHNVGIVIGIVNPSGTEFYSYGKTAISGNQTLNENTVFEIGSITKVFTSILLADMVEQGEVSFEDPIEEYHPSSVRAPTRNGQSITLAHLATHTSGLPRMPSNFYPANQGNPYVDYSVKQMYDFLSNHTLERDIGAQYEYSNYGAGLLGHILALQSGMTYEQQFPLSSRSLYLDLA